VAAANIFDARRQNYFEKLIPAFAYVGIGRAFQGNRPGVIPEVHNCE
jgi:hypothetical protein